MSSVQVPAEWPYDYEGGRKDLRNFDCYSIEEERNHFILLVEGPQSPQKW